MKRKATGNLRIAMSTSMIYGNQEGGLQRYIDCVLAGLAEEGGAEILVFAPACHDSFRCFAQSGIRKVVTSGFWNHPLRNIFWHLFVYPILLRKHDIDVLWIPELRRQVPLFRGCTVTTIHDMARYKVPGKYDAFRMFYHMRVLPRLLKGNRGYIAVSGNTRKDINAYLPIALDRIVVAYNGIDTAAFASMPGDSLPKDVSGRYFLYVARLEHPAKNHVRLIKAFDRFAARNPGFGLVLVGSVQAKGEVILEAIRGAKGSIRHLGFVADSELRALYRGAEALVFPSLYEGFGLPLLEAMACGTAVAAADRGCVPEVCGDAAIFFDPENESSIEVTLERLATDKALRFHLQIAGSERVKAFSWRQSARDHLAVFRAAIGANPD